MAWPSASKEPAQPPASHEAGLPQVAAVGRHAHPAKALLQVAAPPALKVPAQLSASQAIEAGQVGGALEVEGLVVVVEGCGGGVVVVVVVVVVVGGVVVVVVVGDVVVERVDVDNVVWGVFEVVDVAGGVVVEVEVCAAVAVDSVEIKEDVDCNTVDELDSVVGAKLLVVDVPCWACSSSFLYNVRRHPPPHKRSASPVQGTMQPPSSATMEASGKALPHQHWSPFSNPKTANPPVSQKAAHLAGVISSASVLASLRVRSSAST